MRLFFIVSVIVLLWTTSLLGTTISKQKHQKYIDMVHTQLDALSGLYKDNYGVEHKENRKITLIPAKNGQIIAVAQFMLIGLRGSSSDFEMLAVFVSEQFICDDARWQNPICEDGYLLRKFNLIDSTIIGGSGWRFVDNSKSIKFEIKPIKDDYFNKLTLLIPMMSYDEQDANCCPSIKYTAKFEIETHIFSKISEIGSSK